MLRCLPCWTSLRAERLSVLYGASSGGSGTEAVLTKQQHYLTAEDTTAATADQALASFIIIQAALKRSAKLKQYCQRWVGGECLGAPQPAAPPLDALQGSWLLALGDQDDHATLHGAMLCAFFQSATHRACPSLLQ